MSEQTFEQWCAELDRVAMEELGCATPLAGTGNRECWRESFSEGMTPLQAIQEDWSNA